MKTLIELITDTSVCALAKRRVRIATDCSMVTGQGVGARKEKEAK